MSHIFLLRICRLCELFLNVAKKSNCNGETHSNMYVIQVYTIWHAHLFAIVCRLWSNLVNELNVFHSINL